MGLEPASSVFIKILLNRYHKKISEAPVKYLPREIQNALNKVQIASNDMEVVFQPPADQIQGIHYSWILPAIKDHFPQPVRMLMLSALPSQHAEKAWKLLSKTPQKFAKLPLADPVKKFLIDKLNKHLRPVGLLPIDYLPDTPLSFLVRQRKEQLVQFIDFLGLYDLAESIRHIIDKNFLQKLYKCLTAKQKQFLRICLHQQEKIVTAVMEMSTWDGSCQKLDLMLQRRGLLRLGRSLSGMHPDFAWHVAHILDTGRGTLILKYFSPETSPGVTARLVQQVINLNNFLNPKSNP